MFSIFLIYKFRKKSLEKRYQAEKLQERLFKDLYKQLQKEFDTLFGYQKILLDLAENKIKLNTNQKIQVAKNLIHHTNNLQENFSEEMQFSDINVNEAIKNVLLALETKSLEKNVVVTSSLKNDLPPLCCDFFKLQQILLSLIDFSLENRTGPGEIKISVASLREEILIRIEDDSFFFSSKERENLEEISFKFLLKPGYIRFKTTQKIIEAHNGKIYILSKKQNGNIIEIYMPVFQEKPIKRKTNVHQLFE